MKTVRTWCVRILMILFTIIFLYPLFWNLMSTFNRAFAFICYSYFLCAGKIPFCREQADLNHLYGMHFPAGNLYYDSSVSGITGNKRIEQSSGTVPCLCSHAVSVLYFYSPGLYVRCAKGL